MERTVKEGEAMVKAVEARPTGLLENIITYLCFRAPSKPGTTKLMKLVYLVEVYYTRLHGERLTSIPFTYHEHGAFAAEVYAALEALAAKGVLHDRQVETVEGYTAHIREPKIDRTQVQLSGEARAAIDEVLEDWGQASLDDVIAHTKRTLPFVGTKRGDLIDFSRMDAVQEYAKAKGISPEDVMTEAVCGSPELIRAVQQGEKDAREGRFVSWSDVFGEE
jgi:uncharacterized phage-associated protein